MMMVAYQNIILNEVDTILSNVVLALARNAQAHQLIDVRLWSALEEFGWACALVEIPSREQGSIEPGLATS